MHAKYGVFISYGSTIMVKVKVLDMKVKGHGQSTYIKPFGINRNAISKRMYMWNMKALPYMAKILWQILKFLEMQIIGHGHSQRSQCH